MPFNQKHILIFYSIISFFEVISELFFQTSNSLKYLTKPLLMPTLALLFFLKTKNTKIKSEKYLMFIALIFAWLGDVFLMFVAKSNVFFLLGLGSFLVMQLLYGYIFSVSHKFHFGMSKIFWFILVILFCIVTLIVLYPHFNDLKLPVMVYFSCLIFMVFSAFCIWDFKSNSSSISIFIGAILFLISDTFIAFNKFYAVFFGSSFLVMCTYILAQYFIVNGYSQVVCEE